MAKSEKSEPADKSQAIRDHFTANPKAGAKDVVAVLGEKGLKVAPGLVYLVKAKMGNRKRRKRREKAIAVAAFSPRSEDPVALIGKVKNLAQELGGMSKLKQLVEAISE